MAKVRVPVAGTVGKSILIETDVATRTELAAALATLRAPSTTASSGPIATLWRLIREIPTNVVNLAALVSSGLIVRKSDGSILARSIAVADSSRLTITNADGAAGSPTLDTADIAAHTIIARDSGSTGKPAATGLSALLDFFGSVAQGNILHRTAAGWAYLTTGTSEQPLWSGGAAANVSWGRKLLAGTGITFDDSAAGQRTISASGGGGGTLSAEILTDTPTAFWKMDEASGTFADSSGGGFTLTVSGAANYQRSVLIRSLLTTKFAQFAVGANSARATTKLGTSPPLIGDWSAEAVVCCRTFGSNAFRVFEMRGAAGGSTTNDQASLIVLNTGEIVAAWANGAGVNQQSSSGVNLSEGTPHHIAIVKDGTAKTVTFFLDGVQVAEITYANEPTGGSGTLVTSIGQNGAGNNTDDMLVGYVAFYNGIKLTGARVAAHARAAGQF